MRPESEPGGMPVFQQEELYFEKDHHKGGLPALRRCAGAGRRYSFGMAAEADAIESAVNAVLDAGLRTADMMADGCTKVGCTAMGDAILERI